jgi:hypothetical protein
MGDHLVKMTPGWLLPYLLALDTLEAPEFDYKGPGRWAWWLEACERDTVPGGPIPRIEFAMGPDAEAEKHLHEVLQIHVVKLGGWYDEAWLMLVRWLLHGFGRRGMADEVARIPPDVRNAWYELFNLGMLLKQPALDWSAHILQGAPRWMGHGGSRWAKSTAFFATPMNVATMMTEMSFTGIDPERAKVEAVIDPCCGTGSLLLPASNYSLRLSGCDIVPDLCLCAELNGWLWVPWLVYMPAFMRTALEAAQQERVLLAHGETVATSALAIPAGVLECASALAPVDPPANRAGLGTGLGLDGGKALRSTKELLAARRVCGCGTNLEGQPSQRGECWLEGRFYCPRCAEQAWAAAQEKAGQALAGANEPGQPAPAARYQIRLWD